MSTVESALADAAAGAAACMAALGKHRMEDMEGAPGAKIARTEGQLAGPSSITGAVAAATSDPSDGGTKVPMSKAREIRLEQNRKAARESRRRKKTMIEELQRSVIFFSRANSTLKQQNDDLSRLLMQSQASIAAIENGQQPAPAPGQQQQGQVPVPAAPAPAPPVQVKTETNEPSNAVQQAQAQAVATQAVLESQGFPAAAARAAAQTMNAGAMQPAVTPDSLPPQPAPAAAQSLANMQPGATMQAMATFQQAAAAAMQAAMQGMQGIPGVNMATMAAAPVGTNAQQAYTDTMTAFAMQQAAAAAAAGQQVGFFAGNPFLAPMMWPGQAVQHMQMQAVAAAAAAAAAASQPAPAAQAPAAPEAAGPPNASA